MTKTFMLMAHDLSTGAFLKDIAENDQWARTDTPEDWKDPKHSRMATYTDSEWILVPDITIGKSKAKKWGDLSGMYVRSEIWRDLNELDRMQMPGFWKQILTQWKLNKTARSPVVHFNNVVSNVIFMDTADIRWRDLYRGIRSYIDRDEHYRNAVENDAFGGSYIENEISRDILDPILEELLKQDKSLKQGLAEGWFNEHQTLAGLSVLGKILDSAWKGTMKADQKMVRAYQIEDEIFRMATYMRRISLGDDVQTAAKVSRDTFLDYEIHAPWVNAARNTLLPFISYTYRAVPVLTKAIAERPWKIAKYATLAYVLNAIGYLFEPGDEDEERRSMREEEQGRTWIGSPRKLRTPGTDRWNNPIFLDIRRNIPASDVFDLNQSNSPIAVPSWLQLGGPIIIAGEYLLNKQAFTGKEIVSLETDTLPERLSKTAGFFYRSWMPSAPYIPGSWYWNKISNAATGSRDALGREYSIPLAVSSSLGLKLQPQDVELGFAYRQFEYEAIIKKYRQEMYLLASDRERNMISEETFEKRKRGFEKKIERLEKRARETFEGG